MLHSPVLVLVLALLVLTTKRIIHVAVCLLDLAVLVDCSVTPSRGYQNVKDFMVDIISSLNIKIKTTHVGAVSFGTQLKRCCHCYRHWTLYALILSNCR